ncbi:MAG TPA: nitrate- and nitrite sensing domain-containing protein [Streptosporangiaceae bacterium]|nr:nitrate- and nitrite sensing domain-containing protein [Streptosporangiaceae bacterium]
MRLIRSVRFKIVLLLLVPFVALSALWAFAASLTLGEGLNLRHVETVQDHLGYPSGALGSALQAERRLSLVYLGGQDPAVRATLESQRLVTDRQSELFQRLAGDKDVQNVADSEQKRWTNEVLRRLDSLTASRRAVDSRSAVRPQAFSTYTQIINSINGLQASLSTLRDPDVAKDAKNQVAMGRAREVLSQEDALLAGALAAHRITPGEQAEFIKLVGTQRYLYAEAVVELGPTDQATYRKITSSREFSRLQTMENLVTQRRESRAAAAQDAAAPGAAAAPPVSDVDWKTTTSSILTKLRGLELSSSASAEQRSKPIANGIITRIVIAGGFGLAALLIMVVLSIWVGRSVIRELTKLKRAALELASERLPSVIRRLRRGDDVDAAAEAPSLSFATDEIDQVGQAFNAARRTAIQGAIEEAKLRRSISEVFINLARRNQALLHRQLSLLDAMERRVADPDELEDLFRLDHLATRMRRHAEGLIILSGQAPGRGWRNPVPAVDVVRAAAAEVEDYARVTVTPMPRVAIAGQAVADLIHLLAELVENATMFSPPHTTVQVSGQLVAHGFAVEIEDRGLSMDPAALATANERLADPPEFDLSNSARLGLFVVGRLAKRHAIQVTLRTSPYGGTTAIVLVPGEIVVRDDGFELGGLPPALTRRAEESLVPVGAIGGGEPNHAGGSSWFGGPAGGPSGPSAPAVPPGPAQPGYGPPQSAQPGPPAQPGYGPPPSAQQPRPQASGNGFARQASDRPPLPQRRTGDAAPGAPAQPQQPQQPVWHTQPPMAPRMPQPQQQPPSRAPHAPQSPWPPRQPGGSPAEPGTGQFGDRGFGDQPFGVQASGGPDFGGSSFGEPAVGQQRPYVPGQRRSGSPPGGPGSMAPAADSGGSRPELPRRVRQANLAPQLRDAQIPDSLDPGEGSDERSPEELRTMLSSIQKGWLRGRTAAEETDGGEGSDDVGSSSAEPATAAGQPGPSGRSEGTEWSEAAEQADRNQREDQ